MGRSLYRYLVSLSMPMRLLVVLGSIAMGIPVVRDVLMSPFWGVVIGILIGGWAFWQFDSRARFYRQKMILAVFLPTLLSAGEAWWADSLGGISTGAVVLTILGLAIICEPGQFAGYMHRSSV